MAQTEHAGPYQGSVDASRVNVSDKVVRWTPTLCWIIVIDIYTSFWSHCRRCHFKQIELKYDIYHLIGQPIGSSWIITWEATWNKDFWLAGSTKCFFTSPAWCIWTNEFFSDVATAFTLLLKSANEITSKFSAPNFFPFFFQSRFQMFLYRNEIKKKYLKFFPWK